MASASDEGQIVFQVSRHYTSALGPEMFRTEIDAASPTGSGLSVLAAACDQSMYSPSLSSACGSLADLALDLAQGSGTVYLQDTASGATRARGHARRVSREISPDGMRVAYLKLPATYDRAYPEQGELWVAETNGGEAHRVGAMHLVLLLRIGWSPDSSSLVYSDI